MTVTSLRSELCELEFFLRELIATLRSYINLPSDSINKILRRMLCASPSWALGHSRLALDELRCSERSDKNQSLRHKAAARVSSLAAIKLAKFNSRAELEAQVVRLGLALSEGSCDDLSEVSERLSQPAQVNCLTKTTYFRFLEIKAESSFRAQDLEQARALLSKIPEKYRSSPLLKLI